MIPQPTRRWENGWHCSAPLAGPRLRRPAFALKGWPESRRAGTAASSGLKDLPRSFRPCVLASGAFPANRDPGQCLALALDVAMNCEAGSEKRPGVILNPEPSLRCLVSVQCVTAVHGVPIRHDRNSRHETHHRDGKRDGSKDDRTPKAGSIRRKNIATAHSYIAAHHTRAGNMSAERNKPVAGCKPPVVEHNKRAACNTPAVQHSEQGLAPQPYSELGHRPCSGPAHWPYWEPAHISSVGRNTQLPAACMPLVAAHK